MITTLIIMNKMKKWNIINMNFNKKNNKKNK